MVVIETSFRWLTVGLFRPRRHAKQASMWSRPKTCRGVRVSLLHRLKQIFDEDRFDRYVEGLCQRFYADDGRPPIRFASRACSSIPRAARVSPRPHEHSEQGPDSRRRLQFRPPPATADRRRYAARTRHVSPLERCSIARYIPPSAASEKWCAPGPARSPPGVPPCVSAPPCLRVKLSSAPSADSCVRIDRPCFSS